MQIGDTCLRLIYSMLQHNTHWLWNLQLHITTRATDMRLRCSIIIRGIFSSKIKFRAKIHLLSISSRRYCTRTITRNTLRSWRHTVKLLTFWAAVKPRNNDEDNDPNNNHCNTFTAGHKPQIYTLKYIYIYIYGQHGRLLSASEWAIHEEWLIVVLTQAKQIRSHQANQSSDFPLSSFNVRSLQQKNSGVLLHG